MRTKKAEVLDAIEAAFGTAPYPGDAHIAGKTSSCPDEYAYVAAYFKGNTGMRLR